MITIDRKHLALMMECGYILVGLQRFPQAREVFEGIAAMAAESEVPIVAIGSVSFCEGKFKEAVRHYEKALKMNPQSPFARAYLGEALFFLGETDRAIQELTAAAQADAQGKAGGFAKALLDAIAQGFTPRMVSGVEDMEQLQRPNAGKETSHVS
ncbi:MAG: tetratricopeptide repeat protein [Deltaproteobacteria bacterium]|nr:tetratricopeptide repeat protein [Deltaproteobacteria bacterium]